MLTVRWDSAKRTAPGPYTVMSSAEFDAMTERMVPVEQFLDLWSLFPEDAPTADGDSHELAG